MTRTWLVSSHSLLLKKRINFEAMEPSFRKLLEEAPALEKEIKDYGSLDAVMALRAIHKCHVKDRWPCSFFKPASCKGLDVLPEKYWKDVLHIMFPSEALRCEIIL